MLAAPGIVIICMPVNVWRVAIDDVLCAGLRNGVLKGLAPEHKVFSPDQPANMEYLIGNFGDIRLGKAPRFSAKRDIESAPAIKT